MLHTLFSLTNVKLKFNKILLGIIYTEVRVHLRELGRGQTNPIHKNVSTTLENIKKGNVRYFMLPATEL